MKRSPHKRPAGSRADGRLDGKTQSRELGEADPVADLSLETDRDHAFARLFRKHNAELVGYLRRRLGSEQEARDVAQEAYVRVLGLDDGTVVNHLRAYLFRTANNLAVDRLRHRARRASHVPEELVSAELESPRTCTERKVLGQQQLERLRIAIAELPPKCRYAFLRFRIDDASYAQIARELNVSESMVRKHVLRAMRYCKAYLGRTG